MSADSDLIARNDRGNGLTAENGADSSLTTSNGDCNVLNTGQCSITCGSAGGDGLIVERCQCDGSSSDGNLTASGFSFSTGNAGGVGGGGGCGV